MSQDEIETETSSGTDSDRGVDSDSGTDEEGRVRALDHKSGRAGGKLWAATKNLKSALESINYAKDAINAQESELERLREKLAKKSVVADQRAELCCKVITDHEKDVAEKDEMICNLEATVEEYAGCVAENKKLREKIGKMNVFSRELKKRNARMRCKLRKIQHLRRGRPTKTEVYLKATNQW